VRQQVTAAIEPLSGCLRVWLPGNVPGVDEYQFVCSVRYLDPHRIELLGLRNEDQGKSKLTPADWIYIWQSIVNHCREIGITEIHFTRKNTGKARQRIIKVRPAAESRNDSDLTPTEGT
jgi:hypothetical protein